MQGLGRHSEADINFLIDEDLAALSQMLGDKEYLLGRHPCLADASAFGFLDKCVTASMSCISEGSYLGTSSSNQSVCSATLTYGHIPDGIVHLCGAACGSRCTDQMMRLHH